MLAGLPMRRMMFLIGIVFTMLATSLHVDAAAHPGEMHYTDGVQFSDTDGDQEGGSQKSQGGAGLAHHHCSNAAMPCIHSVLEQVNWSAPIFSEGVERALVSRSANPLLEPPSA